MDELVRKKHPRFFIEEFLKNSGKHQEIEERKTVERKVNPLEPKDIKTLKRFEQVCDQVKTAINQEFSRLGDNDKTREADLQKKAIIGEQRAVAKFKGDIKTSLSKLKLLSEPFPSYYRTLEDAVFHELYGLSGLAAWANDYTEEYKNSSSAKLIGNQLYVMINGKMEEQPMRINKKRRAQLRQALLLGYPEERLDAGENEVFLRREDGSLIRASLLSDKYTSKDGDVMVFRKYLLADKDQLTFENLARYGTFPKECCELFKLMTAFGPNVFFVGKVRSGKTTFLQTYQHYEDSTLEGTTVSSDEETNYKKITNGPVVQIIAEGNELEKMEKALKRLDSDYIVMSEVRTPIDYKFYLGITNMGTRRCKCTIHDDSAVAFPRKMATEVVSTYGGDQQATIAQLYQNIDFVFELFEVPQDRSKKRLKGIVELRYDPVKDVCSAHRICKYDVENDSWRWKCDIGDDKKELAIGYQDEFRRFKEILKQLEEENPLEEETVVYPAYYKANEKMNNEVKN